jgi:hypothetical protein
MKLAKLALALLTTVTCLAPLAPARAGSILDDSSGFMKGGPQALCSDKIGAEATSTETIAESETEIKDKSNDTWDNGTTWDDHSKKSSDQGLNIGPFGGKMSDSSENSRKGSIYDKGTSSDESSDTRKGKYKGISTHKVDKAVGKDCAVLGQIADAAAKRDVGLANAAGSRDVGLATVEGQVEMTRIATEGKLAAVKAEANARFMEGLLKW